MRSGSAPTISASVHTLNAVGALALALALAAAGLATISCSANMMNCNAAAAATTAFTAPFMLPAQALGRQ